MSGATIKRAADLCAGMPGSSHAYHHAAYHLCHCSAYSTISVHACVYRMPRIVHALWMACVTYMWSARRGSTKERLRGFLSLNPDAWAHWPGWDVERAVRAQLGPSSEAQDNATAAQPPTVLLLGRGVYALAMARLLKAQWPCGVRIVLASTDRQDFAAASRAIDRCVHIDRPDHDLGAWRSDLLELIGQLQPRLLMPVNEEGMYVSHHLMGRPDVPSTCSIFGLPNGRVGNLLHNKWTFCQLLVRAGVRLPTTRALQVCKTPPPTDCILKRVYSRGGIDAQIWRRGEPWPPQLPENVYAPDSGAAQDAVEWIVQEWISGEPLSSFTVVNDSAVVAHVAYECQLTHGTGFAGLRVTVQEESTIEAASKGATLLCIKRSASLPCFAFAHTCLTLLHELLGLAARSDSYGAHAILTLALARPSHFVSVRLAPKPQYGPSFVRHRSRSAARR